jgi:hypothetical protein
MSSALNKETELVINIINQQIEHTGRKLVLARRNGYHCIDQEGTDGTVGYSTIASGLSAKEALKAARNINAGINLVNYTHKDI